MKFTYNLIITTTCRTLLCGETQSKKTQNCRLAMTRSSYRMHNIHFQVQDICLSISEFQPALEYGLGATVDSAGSTLLGLGIIPEVNFPLARCLEDLLGVIITVLPGVTVGNKEAYVHGVVRHCDIVQCHELLLTAQDVHQLSRRPGRAGVRYDP